MKNILKSKKTFLDLPLLHFRVIKTSLAVFITLFIAKKLNIERAIFPALAAALCIKPTFFGGLKQGYNEIKITIISGLFTAGIIEFCYIFIPKNELPHLIITSLILGIVVAYCMSRNLYKLIPIAILTTLFISIESKESYLLAASIRISSIVVGISIAAIVNGMFISSQYRRYFDKRIKESISNMCNLFSDTVEVFISYNRPGSIEIINRTDNFLHYMYSIREKIENVMKELTVRRRIKGFNLTKARNIKEIIDVSILTLHHIENISQASSILISEIENTSLKVKQPELFSRFEEDLIEICEILLDKFELINTSLVSNSGKPLQVLDTEKLSYIEILFNGIDNELLHGIETEYKDIFLELIAIGRNFRDIGVNIKKIIIPLINYLEN